jgi:hypothetical protein
MVMGERQRAVHECSVGFSISDRVVDAMRLHGSTWIATPGSGSSREIDTAQTMSSSIQASRPYALSWCLVRRHWCR